MKIGLNDRILNRMMELHGKSIVRIKSSLKGEKPFASQPIPPEDLIFAKNTIGYMDILELNMEYGADNVNKMLYDITLMENRRKKSGTIKKEAPVEGFGGQFPIRETPQEKETSPQTMVGLGGSNA